MFALLWPTDYKFEKLHEIKKPPLNLSFYQLSSKIKFFFVFEVLFPPYVLSLSQQDEIVLTIFLNSYKSNMEGSKSYMDYMI